VYRERRARLVAALARELGDALVVLPSVAGLHLSAHLRDRRVDVDALAGRALAAGVSVEPLRAYYQRRARPGLALGFGLISTAKIDEGVRRLGACLRTT
jgi:GntR family transcriptional regulator/MocR family aminotransferase